MFLNYIPSYVRLGELEPLDAFTARDNVDLGDFYPALLDSFRADGVLYGLPRDNDTKVIYYNRDQFAQAGLPLPGPGWTWDDLRNAALTLSRVGAPAGRYALGLEPDFWWLVWVWQNGGDVLDDPLKPTAVRLDSPQSVAALDFLQRLIHVDKVTPPSSQLNTDDMAQLFRDGRLAMMFGNHALVPVFTEQTNLSWDVAPLPRSVERANVAGGAGYVVSRRSQHKDAAWELVKFLTGRKGEAIFAESGIITPARRSVREDNIFLRQQSYRADIFLSETELGRPVPNFRGVTDMNALINAALTPLWRGEGDAASIVRELTPKLQQIIETVK
jgi:multiple sugar transport system substrate-binding protein